MARSMYKRLYWKDRAEYNWVIYVGYHDEVRPKRLRGRGRIQFRKESAEKARAWAKAKTFDPSVLWITVYAPYPAYGVHKHDIHRWSRGKGWRTEVEGS